MPRSLKQAAEDYYVEQQVKELIHETLRWASEFAYSGKSAVDYIYTNYMDGRSPVAQMHEEVQALKKKLAENKPVNETEDWT